MESIDNIFEVFGGASNFGRIIGKRAEHAGSMKARGSIPVKYWLVLIQAAKDRNISRLTGDSLRG
jgi:hypothetical protein